MLWMKWKTRVEQTLTHIHFHTRPKKRKRAKDTKKHCETTVRVYLNRLCLLIMNDLNIHDWIKVKCRKKVAKTIKYNLKLEQQQKKKQHNAFTIIYIRQSTISPHQFICGSFFLADWKEKHRGEKSGCNKQITTEKQETEKSLSCVWMFFVLFFSTSAFLSLSVSLTLACSFTCLFILCFVYERFEW